MPKVKAKILFLSHDVNRAGAQLFLLSVMKDFKEAGVGMELLCMTKWGPLLDEFEQLCKVNELPKEEAKPIARFLGIGLKQAHKFIEQNYKKAGFSLIYANTIACAELGIEVKDVLKIPLITHIHELQFSLELYSEPETRAQLLERSDGIIACSEAVKTNLATQYPHLADRLEVIHSFVDNANVLARVAKADPDSIRNEFDFPKDAFLIGACGNAEWRKGLDIFVNFAFQAIHSQAIRKPIHFVWIGLRKEGGYFKKIWFDVERMGIQQYITFIEPTPKAIEIINTLDLFVVSSREDPFPLVMLEAALCKKPILGFEQSGGCSEFVKDKAGLLAKYLDLNGMVAHLAKFITSPDFSKEEGENGYQQVIDLYNFQTSIKKLKAYLGRFIL